MEIIFDFLTDLVLFALFFILLSAGIHFLKTGYFFVDPNKDDDPLHLKNPLK